MSFQTDLYLDRLFEQVLAYVEFTLDNNAIAARKRFETEIEKYSEFMDCLCVTGDTDYIAFTCCSNTQSLNVLLDKISKQEN